MTEDGNTMLCLLTAQKYVISVLLTAIEALMPAMIECLVSVSPGVGLGSGQASTGSEMVEDSSSERGCTYLPGIVGRAHCFAVRSK